MKRKFLFFLAGVLLAVLAVGSAFGATTIISDNYNVTTTTTGFALDNGVNYGINPPTTRLTGTAAANLRYIQTATGRSAGSYGISSSKLRVTTENTIGRFTLSANGSTPYSFASVLGTLVATPANPAVYDIKISMQNNATSTRAVLLRRWPRRRATSPLGTSGSRCIARHQRQFLHHPKAH